MQRIHGRRTVFVSVVALLCTKVVPECVSDQGFVTHEICYFAHLQNTCQVDIDSRCVCVYVLCVSVFISAQCVLCVELRPGVVKCRQSVKISTWVLSYEFVFDCATCGA